MLIGVCFRADCMEVGFFASAMNGVGKGNYITELSTFGSFVHVRDVETNLVVAKVSQAKFYHLKSLVDVQLCVFPWHSSVPYIDWENRLEKLLIALAPNRDAVLGFYLFDEPFWTNAQAGWQSVTSQELVVSLNAASEKIKELWPETKTGLTFAYKELSPTLVIPNTDWIGFNCYLAFGNECADGEIRKDLDFLLSKKAARQKLIVTLDSYWPNKAEIDRAGEGGVQSNLVTRLQLWKSLIEEHKDQVEILLPFIYQNQPAENLWGAESMPIVRKWLQDYSSQILAHGGAFKLPH